MHIALWLFACAVCYVVGNLRAIHTTYGRLNRMHARAYNLDRILDYHQQESRT